MPGGVCGKSHRSVPSVTGCPTVDPSSGWDDPAGAVTSRWATIPGPSTTDRVSPYSTPGDTGAKEVAGTARVRPAGTTKWAAVSAPCANDTDATTWASVAPGL